MCNYIRSGGFWDLLGNRKALFMIILPPLLQQYGEEEQTATKRKKETERSRKRLKEIKEKDKIECKEKEK